MTASRAGGVRRRLADRGASPRYGEDFDSRERRLSFAGSDELAAQIRQGVQARRVRPANTKLPDALHAGGLVEQPVEFAANKLVLAVPGGLDVDVARATSTKPGVTIAIGSATVPIGSYTREVLARLPAAQREAILANVRSDEPDVTGIVGKLTQGAVDAGFVYVTDVHAASGALRAIQLPGRAPAAGRLRRRGREGQRHPAPARAFVDGLLTATARAALREAGFGPAP